MATKRIVIQGASAAIDVPGLGELSDVELRFAPDADTLARVLPGAEILLGWQFNDAQLQSAWRGVDSLRWIHWCGAGVDSLLFDELVSSDVTVTNARGIFDQAMAEYVLALVLSFAKDLPATHHYARRRYWQHRLTQNIAGKNAVIIGPGSIGKHIAELLRKVGMHVQGVGRTQRNDDVFGTIHALDKLHDVLPQADYVICVLPETDSTKGLLGQNEFKRMHKGARLINVGRGTAIVEQDLLQALVDGQIAGAALDVFETEPLPPYHPFWQLENLIISPHMSGDFVESHIALADQFYANFNRYIKGQPLQNVIDKAAGFYVA